MLIPFQYDFQPQVGYVLNVPNTNAYDCCALCQQTTGCQWSIQGLAYDTYNGQSYSGGFYKDSRFYALETGRLICLSGRTH